MAGAAPAAGSEESGIGRPDAGRYLECRRQISAGDGAGASQGTGGRGAGSQPGLSARRPQAPSAPVSSLCD